MTHARMRSAVEVLHELLARSAVGVATEHAHRIARTVAARARTAEGCKAVTVLVADDGSVYAPKATAACAILAATIAPHWVVGTFSVAADAEAIRDAIEPALERRGEADESRARARMPRPALGWGFA